MELVGVDIGGSNLKAGKVVNGKIEKKSMKSVSKNATYNQVLNDLFACIDEVITPNTKRIGIGVPSIVDISEGIAYDVQNIPAWKLVPLKELIEDRYGILVYLNNDANCFALGEKIYGKGLPYKNFVGLSLGTGIGMGIIINDSLYSGVLCGAGEIGMVSYKESIIENYASSFFFIRKYGLHPIEVFERAEKGEAKSIIAFQDFGFHLAEAIKTILYLYAPEAILIGGSISKAYNYFEESLQTNLKSFPYKKQIENLKIEVSTNQGSPILGAAALCLQEKN